MRKKVFRRKSRFRFRIKNRELIRICAAATAIVFFSLVLLPLFIVAFFPTEDGEIVGKNRGSHTVTLYRHQEGRVITLDLEDYVAGVMAGEMPASFEMEALKAQAVAARTYALSKIRRAEDAGNSAEHPEAPLCDDTHCQVYRSEKELMNLKGKGWMEDGWRKIRQATLSTAGEVMYYQGALVEQPLFHSSSGGKTENSEDVFVSAFPYLRSVDSRFEGDAPYQNESVSVSFGTFEKKVSEKYGASNISIETIKILSRSEGGRVKEIQVGDKVLSGRDIRELFGLRSANFSLAFNGKEDIIFTTRGYGHGVGMSQWGANGMAKAGYSYVEILQHYYLGVSIELL
ncbi:MAG: stage II sporulation protein D [Anaerovoracaceae bacterium]|jgi:stage II sporulation protein D